MRTNSIRESWRKCFFDILPRSSCCLAKWGYTCSKSCREKKRLDPSATDKNLNSKERNKAVYH